MAKAADKLDQFVKITVDDGVEKIIQLDTQGKRLRFAAEPGQFKELKTSEVNKLSEFNKLAYQLARVDYEENQDDQRAEEDDLLARLGFGSNKGQAKSRLFVEGKQAGMVYYWCRPDTLGKFVNPVEKWVIVQKGPERTLGNPEGDEPHVIGTKGSEELILVKRSAAWDRTRKAAEKGEIHEAQESLDDKYKAVIERQGTPAIDDDTGKRLTWKDRGVGEE